MTGRPSCLPQSGVPGTCELQQASFAATRDRCAPCSALPRGTWDALLLETTCRALASPLASGSWAWWGKSRSSVSRACFAERGAHPRISHIPWALTGDARARRFKDPLFTVNLKQVQECKPRKGKMRSKGELSKSTRDL